MILTAMVSDIGRSFERQLADWQTRYADRPTREMVRLCLLALEREENVAVAYDQGILGRRLAAMPLPDTVRELFQQALVWVWKTEEMHAIYVRGALLKLGQPLVDARTLLQQAAGAVGGWTVSVRQHRRWSEAPLSQAAATLLTAAGGFTGRVPREVRRHLRYSSFRDFCRYNVDTEGTAWLCWQRLTELASQVPLLSGGHVDDFRRVADDEDRHGQVFTILAEALTEDDRLREGVTDDALAARIEAVGESFLPHARRRHGARNPVGSGAPVFVVHAGPHGNTRELLRELLRNAGLPRVIQERARALGRRLPALRIAVKTNFMTGHISTVATHSDLVEELALVAREAGAVAVAVLARGGAAGPLNGSFSVAQRGQPGFASPFYDVVDCAAEQVGHAYSRGMGQYTIARTWRDADVRIVFSKLGASPVSDSTMIAMEGVGGASDHFHCPHRQVDRETAIMMVLDDFPPHFCVLDCSDQSVDLRPGRRGSAQRRAPQRLYASEDALALDGVAASHIGAAQRGGHRVSRAAEQWFGKLTRETPRSDSSGTSLQLVFDAR